MLLWAVQIVRAIAFCRAPVVDAWMAVTVLRGHA